MARKPPLFLAGDGFLPAAAGPTLPLVDPGDDPGAPGDSRARALETLERLLALSSAEVAISLTQASDLVARALRADKVDVFLYDPGRETLAAVGSSTQPLSNLQKRLGLDVLPLANGGRVVLVFQSGETHVTGRLDQDLEEVRGVKEALAVRSQIGVPLVVDGVRRGVLMVGSQQPDFFDATDVRFAEMVVRWIGMVTHRAELVEQIAANSVEQGRRAVAEDLMTVLAHDLRNLILPISIRLSLIRGRAAADQRSLDLRDAEQAGKAAERLSRLVTDILDTARLDRGIFELNQQPVDLTALAREVATVVSTPATEVQVLAAETVMVVADPERLRQALENIMSNGVQHSPEHAPITVTVAKRQTNGGPRVYLTVRDQGPGIPSELLPRIFERFAAGEGSEGLGLGLYLARRIVAAHGGQVEVTSSPGQGAEFVISLPALVE